MLRHPCDRSSVSPPGRPGPPAGLAAGRGRRTSFPGAQRSPRPLPCPLGLPSPHPLGLHGLGHEVVLVHGAHPLADGGAGLGHLGDGGRLELFIVDVWLDGFDHRLPNVVLGMGTMGSGGCFPGRTEKALQG